MINYSEIKTDRVRLSKLTLKDAKAIFEYASDERVTKFLMWKTHMSINDTISYVQFCIDSLLAGKTITWGIHNTIDNKLMGTVDLSEFDENVYEIGYVIGNKFWGNGYATEVVRAVIDYVKSIESVAEVVGIAFEGNYESTKVLTKCGMRYIEIVPNYFNNGKTTINGVLYSTKK